MRQDPLLLTAQERYAYAAAVETLEYVEDETVRRRLERTPPRHR